MKKVGGFKRGKVFIRLGDHLVPSLKIHGSTQVVIRYFSVMLGGNGSGGSSGWAWSC